MTSAPSAGGALPLFHALWDYRDPAATEARFRALLPEVEAAGDRSEHAELLTQVARTLGLRGMFDASHATLDAAERLVGEARGVARARLLLERGRAFNSAGRPEAALPCFREAYALASEIGARFHAIDAAHMVAIAEPSGRDRVDWNLRGIALAEAEPSFAGWLKALLNNLGEAYAALGEFHSARDCFRRLVAIYRDAGQEPDMYAVKDEARMSRLGGDPGASLSLVSPVFESLQGRNADDGWIREELAEALHALGRAGEAAPHFARAYALLSADPWCSRHEPEKLRRLKEMAGEAGEWKADT